MWTKEKEFYIAGKRVVREINKDKNDVPIYFCHDVDGNVQLRAYIATGFKSEYTPLLHLYEHLMFHNVIIDDVVYSGLTELMTFADKHNIQINAGTGGNGIVVKVDINNPTSGNRKLGKTKNTKKIGWIDKIDVEDNIEMGFKILYGILYNRKELTREDIEKEIGVVESEMHTMANPTKKAFFTAHKFIMSDSGYTLGTPEDFKNIGTDKIVEILMEFDKNICSSDHLNFGVYFDMDEYSEASKVYSLARWYFDFPIRNHRLVCKPYTEECKKYMGDFYYALDISQKVNKLDDEVKSLSFASTIGNANVTKGDFIRKITELHAYSTLLNMCIWDISYGIFNYIREEKKACYTAQALSIFNTLNRISYFKMLIENKIRVFEMFMCMFVPLNGDVNVEELAEDVKKYIDKLEISKDRFEEAKNIILSTYADIDTDKAELRLLVEYEWFYRYIKSVIPSDDRYIEEALYELYNYDISKYDYETLNEYLDMYKDELRLYITK